MRFDPILAILLLLYKVIFMLASQFSKLYNLLVNNLLFRGFMKPSKMAVSGDEGRKAACNWRTIHTGLLK